MRKILAMGLCAAAAFAASPARAGMGGGIAWSTDYSQGLAEARDKGRPLLLYFTASW